MKCITLISSYSLCSCNKWFSALLVIFTKKLSHLLFNQTESLFYPNKMNLGNESCLLKQKFGFIFDLIRLQIKLLFLDQSQVSCTDVQQVSFDCSFYLYKSKSLSRNTNTSSLLPFELERESGRIEGTYSYGA